jgi:hypothetical protein
VTTLTAASATKRITKSTSLISYLQEFISAQISEAEQENLSNLYFSS